MKPRIFERFSPKGPVFSPLRIDDIQSLNPEIQDEIRELGIAGLSKKYGRRLSFSEWVPSINGFDLPGSGRSEQPTLSTEHPTSLDSVIGHLSTTVHELIAAEQSGTSVTELGPLASQFLRAQREFSTAMLERCVKPPTTTQNQ